MRMVRLAHRAGNVTIATNWTNWPLAERQSPPGGPASEMNDAFFVKFHNRDENLRSRIGPGDDLSGKIYNLTTGVWTPIGSSSVVWIPRWARLLVVRCSMVAQPTGPPQGISGSARPKLGTIYGTEMTVAAQGGLGGGDGTLENTEAVIVVPTSMQDTEQSFTYEVRSNSNDAVYVRVFNDSIDATDGTRHRHWIWEG